MIIIHLYIYFAFESIQKYLKLQVFWIIFLLEILQHSLNSSNVLL